jgi:hypothetical protein
MAQKFILFLIFLITFGYTSLHAQEIDSVSTKEIDYTDSALVNLHPPKTKHFWRASGELFLCELIPWSFNYFVRDAEFSHISFQSIGHNLKPSSWEWDDNNFKTNQFGHPYHGNLFYNSFRGSGYSFWQAAPAAFAGSFIWEIAGETHNPAPNDFINTSLGGIALGEMTYRISNLIINNKSRGVKRQVQEILGTMVCPVNSFNRIIDGKWGKVEFADPEDSVRMDIAVDLGLRRISETAGTLFTDKGQNEWCGSVLLRYGNPFKDYKKPFDNFNVYLELGGADSSALNTLTVMGSIWGKIIGGGEHSTHILRLSMNYDYFHNTTFQYGGQSILMSWLAHYDFSPKFHFNTELGTGAIVLGASPDHYLYYGEGRNYDYGPGVAYNAGCLLNYADKLFATVNYRGGWTFTVNGNSSTYWLQGFKSELRYMIYKGFSVSGVFGNYQLHGYYKDYTDTRDKYPYLRISAGYKLVF